MSSIPRYILHPATALAVGYGAGMVLYGNDLVINAFGKQVSLPLALGIGSAVGSFLMDSVVHDLVIPHLSKDARVENIASNVVGVGTQFGAQALSLSLMNSNAFNEVDKMKLLGEALAVHIGTDWLYEKVVAPMIEGKSDQVGTY
jgi:hypothetical protein